MRERLAAGFTMTFELDRRQVDFMVGALSRGEVPQRPYGTEGLRGPWQLNQRVQIQPGGLDVIGPIDLTTARDLRPWASAWTLPADFIKLRKIIDVAGNPIDKFDIRRIDGARRIVTGDYPEIFLDCVKYTDAPDEDPNFLQAFVTLLASRLARAITGNEELESKLLSQYEGRDLVNARLADAHDSQSNENHPLQEIIDGALINSHGSFF